MRRSQEGTSDFIFLKSEMSFCPHCNKNVYLMTSGGNSKGMPSFFICFDCKFIGEIGVGVVKEEK